MFGWAAAPALLTNGSWRHELTHVVQQRPEVRTLTPDSGSGSTPALSRAPAKLQREGTWDAVTGLFDSPREKVNTLAMKIPGYRLLTLILKQNPILGERVERTPGDMTSAVLALLPGGVELKKKIGSGGDGAGRFV